MDDDDDLNGEKRKEKWIRILSFSFFVIRSHHEMMMVMIPSIQAKGLKDIPGPGCVS